METLMILLFACSPLSLTINAVPLAMNQDVSESIIMPGVSIRKVVKEDSTPVIPLFKHSNSEDSVISISVEDPTRVISNTKKEAVTNKSKLDGNISNISITEESGPPNPIFFPNGGESFSVTTVLTTSQATPMPILTENYQNNGGSGDGFLFPGSTRVNMESSAPNSETTGALHCEPSSGAIDINGTCTRYLARNKCAEGEWFVKKFDETGGGCEPRPCPTGELLFKGKCLSVSDENACANGLMLYVDFSGFVHCDCKPNLIYDPWSGDCYAQGDQGFCNVGEQLALEENGVMTCKRNPCLMNGFVYHNSSGRCYQKMYNGFCDDGLIIVYSNNRTAECSAIAAHSIFDLPTLRSCIGGTIRDYAGACREEFRVPTASTFPVLHGDCPFGFIKDRQGSCRKTHKLFG